MIERIRIRVLLSACAAFTVLALVTVWVLAVTGAVDAYEATLLTGLVVIFALAVVGAMMSLRAFVSLRSKTDHVAARIESQVRAVQAETAEISAAVTDLGHHYKAMAAEADERNEAMSRDLLKQVARQSLQLYWQLEALMDLRAWITPRAPLPSLRGWAASPDVLRWMLAWIHDHRPALIVECGSGASTVLFGYQVQRIGAGKVISLEHDPLYASRTRELARRHDVGDVIQVRDAPLQTWQESDGVWQWYNRAAIEDITEIDLLFVDGPPGATGHLARFPAGPLLFGKLAAAGVAVLDDALRDDEKRTSELWLERMEWLERERLKTEKGTDIFRRRVGT